ncbi:hypothetical protein [Bordetella sp. 2513F-2]
MRLILHIGTEKTGTTTFQKFCHANRALLRRQGVLYPQFDGGGVNHRFLAMCALPIKGADKGIRRLGFKSQKEMNCFYDAVESQLIEQVAEASDCHTCIISSEHFHSRLKTVEQVYKIKEILSPLYETIDVYVHLRPQVDVVVSLASTQARVGDPVRQAFFDGVMADKPYYNYDMLVSLWETVFGKASVRCIPFKSSPDFIGALGKYVQWDLEGMPVPKRANEAMDVRVMAMVNALVDSGSSQRIDIGVLNRLPTQQKLTLDIATARAIQKRFEESNASLISRRSDLLDGELEPDWSRYPEKGNLHILEQECCFAEPFARLVGYYNSEINRLRQMALTGAAESPR